MNFSDIIFVLRWWLMFFIIGIIFLPITYSIFNKFFDRGYIFSKIIGIALISYVIFVLGILKLAPFTELTIILTLAGFLILNLILIQRPFPTFGHWKIFVFEEILFLATLFFWSYIRVHEPSIHGLEKYMDFGFVNSILRSTHFPPVDMWFSPLPINYYYFGHLVTAVLTKLSLIPPPITYNLMLSTIFAFTFTASFSIGANLLNSKVKTTGKNSKFFENLDFDNWRLFGIWKLRFGAWAGGLLTAFLVSLAGNLHTIYALFKPYPNENPLPFWQLPFAFNSFPNGYWYPNATRFIENTIHEFPIYSAVVSDLHGHYLDVPFVLLIIAVLLSLIFNSKFEIFNQVKMFKTLKIENSFQIGNLKLKILLISFLLAVMYMTNAWDGLIYFLLAALVLLFICIKQSQTPPTEIKNEKLKIKNSFQIENFKLKILSWLLSLVIIAVTFTLFTLPFNLHFKPFASGIGILCAPEFLTNIGKLGPFLFEKDHCQRSPLWQLLILYGFFYFWVISFIIFLFKNSKHETRNPKQSRNSNVQNGFGNLIFGHLNLFRISNLGFRISSSDLFVLLLILFSTFLVILPEFIYVKDIYPGHYRANTMFKLVYQAFIMLSIASAYICVRLISNINPSTSSGQKTKIFPFVYLLFAILFLILVMIYPYFAINSYYGDLKKYNGLDGTAYLKPLYPNDYQAILWINKNIKGQPVILEAQGDSYTDYARVSSNTGLPTILGWTVHEWLWRGSYDIPSPRIEEVQKMYESEDLEETKNLLEKHKVELVFLGDLERQKYPNLNEDKFKTLGKVIYENGETKIYEITF